MAECQVVCSTAPFALEIAVIGTLTASSLLALKPATSAKLRSPLDWVQLVRAQLPAAVIDSVTAATGISQAELVRSLGLVERTIVRRKKEGDLLAQDETEKLVRFAQVTERACHVFERDPTGLAWLRSPNPSLDGNRPLDLLDTDVGAGLVLDTLGRIEHGVFG